MYIAGKQTAGLLKFFGGKTKKCILLANTLEGNMGQFPEGYLSGWWLNQPI